MDKIDKNPEYKFSLFKSLVQDGKNGALTNPIDKIIYECIVNEIKEF
jgi:hypothetical protein